MSDTLRLTPYQLELLETVRAGNLDKEEGGPIDFDQLIETLSWKPTKAAAHFSIRALVKRGLLVKTGELMLRRGRQRVGFELTQNGRAALDPREAFVEEKVSDQALKRNEEVTSGTEIEELPGLLEVLEDC
jgi:DNA-binding PadR family transcriptional regulator